LAWRTLRTSRTPLGSRRSSSTKVRAGYERVSDGVGEQPRRLRALAADAADISLEAEFPVATLEDEEDEEAARERLDPLAQERREYTWDD